MFILASLIRCDGQLAQPALQYSSTDCISLSKIIATLNKSRFHFGGLPDPKSRTDLAISVEGKQYLERVIFHHGFYY